MYSVAELQTDIQRFKNFLGFARSYLRRNNPIKIMISSVEASLKDMLTIHKKVRLSKYRVTYHMHQFKKMEALIASNNEHTFLKGRNLNQIR